MERVPISACVANLMLHPCDATVRDLDDCVMSIWAMAVSDPSILNHYVGAGCFPFQAHSSCDTTIVQHDRPETMDCLIPTR